MGSTWNGTWLAMAFLSELAALAALGFWGFTTQSGALRYLLGLGVPLVAAVLWGVFAAPQAPVQIVALNVLVKVLVFGSAVLALAATGHPRLAAALAVAALLGATLSTAPVGSATAS